MGREYKIKFSVLSNYDTSALFQKLPNSINRELRCELHSDALELDGSISLIT